MSALFFFRCKLIFSPLFFNKLRAIFWVKALLSIATTKHLTKSFGVYSGYHEVELIMRRYAMAHIAATSKSVPLQNQQSLPICFLLQIKRGDL
jgi:hypothetical protein